MKQALCAALLGMIFLVAPVCSAGREGDDISVSTHVSRYTINVGDRIFYTVEVKPFDNLKVEFPVFLDDMIGDFEIKDSSERINSMIFGDKKLIKRYELTCYKLGKHQIPAIEVKYSGQAVKWAGSKKTAAVEIYVESILPKSGPGSDIKDIKGPLGVRKIKWWYLIAAVAVILISTALFLYVRRSKMFTKELQPYESAMAELSKAGDAFSKNRDTKEYYVMVSDCIRHYIERVFRFRAPEMTTEEFLYSLDISSLVIPDKKELLKDFLSACDLVKFAKYSPSGDEVGQIRVTAKKFIEETKDVHI